MRTFGAEEPLYITGAPKAFKGKVLIGNGGTEIGPTRGYVTAYDAETGARAWRFHIVPGNPASVRVEIRIREGRNRQVRRMTAAVGHPTLRLIRYRVGSWTLDGIGPGEWREL